MVQMFNLVFFLAIASGTGIEGQRHHGHTRGSRHSHHRGYTPSYEYMKAPPATLYPRGYEFAIKGFDLDPPDAPRNKVTDPDYLFRNMFALKTMSKHAEPRKGLEEGKDEKCHCRGNVCHCYDNPSHHPHAKRFDGNTRHHTQHHTQHHTDYRNNYRQGRLPSNNGNHGHSDYHGNRNHENTNFRKRNLPRPVFIHQSRRNHDGWLLGKVHQNGDHHFNHDQLHHDSKLWSDDYDHKSKFQSHRPRYSQSHSQRYPYRKHNHSNDLSFGHRRNDKYGYNNGYGSENRDRKYHYGRSSPSQRPTVSYQSW